MTSSENENEKRHSQEFWDDIETKLVVDPDSIKQLIKNGTITMKDISPTKKWRLLEHAIKAGNYDIIQLCLNLGADIDYWTRSMAKNSEAYHCKQLILSSGKGANIKDKIENVTSGMNQQNGIIENIMNEVNNIGQQSKEIFEKVVIEMMINIIQKKLIFSDDLLGLCWKIEANKGDPLESEIWKAIKTTCSEILKGQNKRDWYWLKTYMIPSKVKKNVLFSLGFAIL